MIYPALMLFIHLDSFRTFQCFSNLILNDPYLLAFYRFDGTKMTGYLRAFDRLLSTYHPKVADHLAKEEHTLNTLLMEWTYTVFSRAFNLTTTLLIWDLYLQHGFPVLFKAALLVFHLTAPRLLATSPLCTLRLVKQSTPHLDHRQLIPMLYDPSVYPTLTATEIKRLSLL